MQVNKNKIPVGILGATGSVGQKFVQLLADHPIFEVAAVAASERSQNKRYHEAANWFMPTAIPEQVAKQTVRACVPDLPCRIVFSGLDANVAGEIEQAFARAGYLVVSNARNHRMQADVPLLIPEVNADHLALLQMQNLGRGGIVTNPNCSTIGLTMALKPLHDRFGIESVHVVTMQALSGAGYPGVASLDILDNVIPFIGGEEEKMESEPLKLLGTMTADGVKPADFAISAQCNRVGVSDGHQESVSVKLSGEPSAEEVIAAWQQFTAEPQTLALTSAPKQPVHYFHEDNYPQPKLHRELENGMAVSVGRLRACKVLDYKFELLVHNTIRGAAGCAILNAELMVARRLV